MATEDRTLTERKATESGSDPIDRTTLLIGLSRGLKGALQVEARKRGVGVSELMRVTLAAEIGYDLSEGRSGGARLRGRPKGEARKVANSVKRALAQRLLADYRRAERERGAAALQASLDRKERAREATI